MRRVGSFALALLALAALGCAALDYTDEFDEIEPYSFERFAIVGIDPLEGNPGFIEIVLALKYRSGSGVTAVYLSDEPPDRATLRELLLEEAASLPVRDKLGMLVKLLDLPSGAQRELTVDDIYDIEGVSRSADRVYLALVSFPDEPGDGPVLAKLSALEMGDEAVNGEPPLSLLESE